MIGTILPPDFPLPADLGFTPRSNDGSGYQPPKVGASQVNPFPGFDAGAGFAPDDIHHSVAAVAKQWADAHANPTPENQALRDQIANLYKMHDQHLQGALTMPFPTEHGPGTKQLLAAALIGALGGNSALANTVQGYQGGADQSKQNAFQLFQQKQNAAIQGAQSEADQAGRLEQTRAQLQAQSNTDRQFNQNQQNITESRLERQDRARVNDQYRQDQLDLKKGRDLQTNVERQQRLYHTAKTEGEMLGALGNWRRLEKVQAGTDPNFVSMTPTDEQAKADFGIKTERLRQDARKSWKDATAQVLQQFGEVPADQVPAFQAMRRQLVASTPGLTEDSLPPIPTGETLRKQAFTEKKKEYQQTFTRLGNNHIDAMANAHARFEIARKQLEISQKNSDYEGARVAISRLEAAQKVGKNATGAAIDSLTQKIIGAKAEMDSYQNSGATDAVKRTAQAKYDSLKAQKADLVLSQQEFMTLPDMGNPQGGTQIPNPFFKGSLTPGTPNGFAPPSISGPIGIQPVKGNIGSANQKHSLTKKKPVTLPPGVVMRGG